MGPAPVGLCPHEKRSRAHWDRCPQNSVEGGGGGETRSRGRSGSKSAVAGERPRAQLPSPPLGGSGPAPRGLECRPQPPEPGALRMGGNTLRGYAREDDASTRVREKHGRHAGHVHSSCRSLFTNFIKRGRKDSFVEPLVSLILGGLIGSLPELTGGAAFPSHGPSATAWVASPRSSGVEAWPSVPRVPPTKDGAPEQP